MCDTPAAACRRPPHTQAEDKVWADLSVEMSEVALLVAEGVWEDLLQDTAETIASLEEGEQQEQEQRRQPAGLQHVAVA
jgi:hypothetical protein